MGGKIYVTGGVERGNSVSSVCVYDPQADAWTQLASMGTSRNSHAAAAVGDKLYIFGGHDGRRSLADLHIFDTESMNWSKAAVS